MAHRYNGGAEVEAGGDSWKDTILEYGKNVATIAVCSYILIAADVAGVMIRSKKIYRNVLYASGAAYAIFFGIWFFLTVIVSRTNPNWEQTHMQFIYVATGAVSVGAVLWVVAVWPVFHIWTIPLGLVILFLFLSLLALLPAKKKKAD
mmetsp:Transcript_32095/g.37036  ORF Transcript_32095/g.37036 Transcript_32095/m.37036 type:complete len:148 (+) Transcript_32095:64-507(+)